jgi:hypothetical protein
MHPPIFTKQQLGEHVPAAMNTHATIEEILDVLFYKESVSYQTKVGDYFFPELLDSYCPNLRLSELKKYAERKPGLRASKLRTLEYEVEFIINRFRLRFVVKGKAVRVADREGP